jgi:hypothetical protein
MRKNIGLRKEEDVMSRQFCNWFEYLFGESTEDIDSDNEGTRPLLSKKSCNSSIATATNRPINATFSYTSSDPTVFKPKLNFISTKDVMKVMIDGSKDFCASKARARCRLLQKPEMWARLLEKSDKITGAEYESMIYQLMEFRLLFEYLNGGSGGSPFQNIKSAYPTDEEKWSKKEKEIDAMEAGEPPVLETQPVVDLSAAPTSVPKRAKKKKFLEKILLQIPVGAESKPTSSSESSDDESSESEIRRSVGTSSSTVAAMTPLPQTYFVNEEEDEEWIEVGAPRRINVSGSKVENLKPVRVVLPRLSEKLCKRQFKCWTRTQGAIYKCDSSRQVAVYRRTFIDIVPIKSFSQTQECPF